MVYFTSGGHMAIELSNHAYNPDTEKAVRELTHLYEYLYEPISWEEKMDRSLTSLSERLTDTITELTNTVKALQSEKDLRKVSGALANTCEEMASLKNALNHVLMVITENYPEEQIIKTLALYGVAMDRLAETKKYVDKLDEVKKLTPEKRAELEQTLK